MNETELEAEKQEENSDSIQITFSDKLAFIVGFATIILAFSSYKEQAQRIFLLPELSLYNLAGIFLAMLFAATYLYGVNYIRYDFPSLLRIKWLRFIELTANILYLVAFSLPLLVAMGFLVFRVTDLFHFKVVIPYINISVSSVVIIGIAVFAFISYRYKVKEIKAMMNDEQSAFSRESSQGYREGDYRVSLLQLFRALVLALQSRLVSYVGTSVNRIPLSQLINLASNHDIISKEDAVFLKELTNVRNQISHRFGPQPFDKAQTDTYITKINGILDKVKG